MSLDLRKSRPKVYGWPTADPSDRVDLSLETIAYDVQRSVNTPAGSFNVTLLPRTTSTGSPLGLADTRRIAELVRSFDPMDMISIGHEEEGGIVLGLISDVTWGTQLVGGQPNLTLTFSGQDFGKLLVQDSILRATIAGPSHDEFRRKVSAALGEDNPVTMPLLGLAGLSGDWRAGQVPPFIAGSVQDLVDWIFRVAPSFSLPVLKRMPAFASGRLADIFDTRVINTWNNQRVYRDSLSAYQGSIRGFLEAVLDMDFYECWVDYVPTGEAVPNPILMIRPKPFDEDGVLDFAPVREDTGAQWKSLRTLIEGLPAHEIGLDQVHNISMTRSDSDAASFFQVTSLNELIGNAQAEADGLTLPLVDTFAAKRFGMRAYKAQLSMLAQDMARLARGEETDVATIASEGQEFRNRLFNWHRLQPWFESGTITVTGKDRYRPGDPVELPWAIPCRGKQMGMRYYCHSTRWTWQYGAAPTTTLSVVRGHNDALIEAMKREIRRDAPAASPDHYAAI